MSLPFQVWAGGSQTSILISESGTGRATAVTRQNAGSVGAGPRPAGAGDPAGTAVAAVIAVAGMASAARLSQVAARAIAPFIANRIGSTASERIRGNDNAKHVARCDEYVGRPRACPTLRAWRRCGVMSMLE